MSNNGYNGTSEVAVEDEEGFTDTQVKKQIFKTRAAIDDDERLLFVDRLHDPAAQLTYAGALQAWTVSVRQYLRGIKRLWDSDDGDRNVANAERYWQEKHLGTVRLVPPDKRGYEFSLIDSGLTPKEVRFQLGLPREASVPRVKEEQIFGLEGVLERDSVSAAWTVTVDDSGPPKDRETLQLQRVQPLPKHILEAAVEAADNFLQGAKVGFALGVPDYYGGEEPGL